MIFQKKEFPGWKDSSRQRGQAIDMRVSSMPTIHGEKIVIRLLNRATLWLIRIAWFFKRRCSSFRKIHEKTLWNHYCNRTNGQW
jgi:type II secretory ATPase GspE/PulE/Tfp pilus assembly ATPase PilB-like protein